MTETVTMANEDYFVYAFVDYRKDDAVDVKIVDEEHYEVTLKFYARLEDPYEGVDVNMDELLKEWCSQWTRHEVAKEFGYTYRVLDRDWISPGVFRMVIEHPTHMGDVDTPEKMKAYFVNDCLEDTFYEGFGNFWIIPRCQKRIPESEL